MGKEKVHKPKDIGSTNGRKDILPVEDQSNVKESADGVKTVNPSCVSISNGTKVPVEECSQVGMGLSTARDRKTGENCENQFSSSSNNVYSGNQYPQNPWNIGFPYPQPMSSVPFAHLQGYQHPGMSNDTSSRIDKLELNMGKILDILSKKDNNMDKSMDIKKGNDDFSHGRSDNMYEDVSDAEGDRFSVNTRFSPKHDGDSVDLNDSLEAPFGCVKEGVEVDPSVASFVNKMCTQEPDWEYFREVSERYATQPKNCKYVVVPEMDKTVANNFARLDANREKQLVSIQKNAVKSVVANTKLLDMLKSLKQDNPDCEVTQEMYNLAKDSVFLAAHTSFKLSSHRRCNAKSNVADSFVGICDTAKNPITDKLFGDDVIKACKDIGDDSRAMEKVLKQPYQSKSYAYNRRPFGQSSNYLRGVRGSNRSFGRGYSRSSYNSSRGGYNNNSNRSNGGFRSRGYQSNRGAQGSQSKN